MKMYDELHPKESSALRLWSSPSKSAMEDFVVSQCPPSDPAKSSAQMETSTCDDSSKSRISMSTWFKMLSASTPGNDLSDVELKEIISLANAHFASVASQEKHCQTSLEIADFSMDSDSTSRPIAKIKRGSDSTDRFRYRTTYAPAIKFTRLFLFFPTE